MSVRATALILVCILLLASAILLAPRAAGAQQAEKVYRIGFLRADRPPATFVEGFQQGLRERGYVDGQNVVIEYRFTEGSLDQLPQLAEELVRRKVDVILASAAPAALAAKQATTSVPIVFVGVVGPVELGLVPGLARPGGNITGLAISPGDLVGKRLELLREIVPTLRRVAVLWHPTNPGNHVQLQGAEVAAQVRWACSCNGCRSRAQTTLTLRSRPPRRRRGAPARRFPVHDAPYSPRRIGSEEPTARDLRLSGVCGGWRPHVLRSELRRICTGVPPPTWTRS